MSVPTLKKGRAGAEAINDATKLDEYTVAGAPAASLYTGRLIHVSDGDAGSPCLAYSNGTDWLRITLGAAIAAV